MFWLSSSAACFSMCSRYTRNSSSIAHALGHVALDAEVTGDAPFRIVEAQIVAFDVDRGAVEAALVGLDMQPAAIEEIAPHAPAVRQVVLEEVLRRHPQELLARHAVLGEHGVVHFRHALVVEGVVERTLLVDGVVPPQGLVEHHEEEPVEGLREEHLEAIVGVHGERLPEFPEGGKAWHPEDTKPYASAPAVTGHVRWRTG